jgi:nitroreductase
MDSVIDIIKSRRSVRSYRPAQLKESELQDILDAGAFAPSAMNGQTWHFTVIQDQALLDKLSGQVREILKAVDNPKLQERLKDPNYHTFYHAPTLVVISGQADAMFHVTDCAAATQNLLLAAHSLGIGSCWIGIISRLLESPVGPELTRALQVPAGYRPLHAVALGYPAGDAPAAAPRKEGTINYIK